ncbi:MAG: hypothetical protein N3B16_11100 [Candidatus Aminicenantes bacterium]|nr:hypothetical protein [Candidatus Aminicenantes bacterium]
MKPLRLTLFISMIFLLYSFVTSSPQEWKNEAATLFLQKVPFSEIASFLEAKFDSLNDEDKATATLILAYSWQRTNNLSKAYTWLARFFEDFRGEGAFFDFLPRSTQNDLWFFLRFWQGRYPLVTDLSFLIPAEKTSNLSPPDNLILAVQVTNSAFFKLISEGETIKAGLLQKGLNTLSLESSPLIRESGTRTFFLELKAEDLIIRREITIQVNLSSELLLSAEPQADLIRKYRVSLLLGNKLLAQSQSTFKLTPPIQITLPPADGRFSPYGPVHPSGQNPQAIGVSIFSLPAVIADLIKEFKSKKEEKERIPAPAIKREIQFVYLNQTQRGLEKMTADLKLEEKGYQALVFSLSSS